MADDKGEARPPLQVKTPDRRGAGEAEHVAQRLVECLEVSNSPSPLSLFASFARVGVAAPRVVGAQGRARAGRRRRSPSRSGAGEPSTCAARVPAGREIVAVVGELDVPASTVTCAGCHGARGEGKTEGGVTAGSLMWSHLLKPYGHTHPTGRKHGPFNESSFIRAVTSGVDPVGQRPAGGDAALPHVG